MVLNFKPSASLLLTVNMSSSSKPYSLENPPQAPKKKPTRESLAERRGRLSHIPKLVLPSPEKKEASRPEWRLLAESGYVREKFLNFTPEDAEEIDDIDSLIHLRELYFPSSQPRNHYEAVYIQLVREALEARLYKL